MQTLPAGARVLRQQGDLVEIALPQDSMRDLGAPVDWSTGALRGAPLRPAVDLGSGAAVGTPRRPPLYSPSTEFVAPRARRAEQAPEAPSSQPQARADAPLPPSRPTHQQRRETPTVTPVDWRTPRLAPETAPGQPRAATTRPEATVQTSPASGSRRPATGLRPGPLSRAVQLRGLSSAFDEGIDWARAGLKRAPIHSPDAQTIGRRRTPSAPALEESVPLPRGLPADAPPPPVSRELEPPPAPGATPGPRLGRAPDLRGSPREPRGPEQLRGPAGAGTPTTPLLARRAAWDTSVEVPLRRTRQQEQTETAWDSPAQRTPDSPSSGAPARPQGRGLLRPPTVGAQRSPDLSGSYNQSIDWSRAGSPQRPLLSRVADTGATIRRARPAPSEAGSTTAPSAAPELQPTPPQSLRQSARPGVDWRRPPEARLESRPPAEVAGLSPRGVGAPRPQGAPSTLPSRGLQARAQQTEIGRARPRDLRDAFAEGHDWRSPELASESPRVAPTGGERPRLSPAVAGEAQTPTLARQQAWQETPTVGPRRTSQAQESVDAPRRRPQVRSGGPRSLAARGRGIDFRTPPSTSPPQARQGGPATAPIHTPDTQHIGRRADPEPAKGLGTLAPPTRDPQSGAASGPNPAPLAQFQAYQGSPTFIAPRKAPEPPPEKPADSSSSSLQTSPPSGSSRAPSSRAGKSGAKRVQERRDGRYHPPPFEADEEAWASGDFPDIEWQAEPAKRRRAPAPKPESSPPPDVLQEMAREQMVEVLKTLTTQSPEARELLEEIMDAVERMRALDHMRKF